MCADKSETKPQSSEKQNFPPRATRENFLEVVTLGLEYRLSRWRGDSESVCHACCQTQLRSLGQEEKAGGSPLWT